MLDFFSSMIDGMKNCDSYLFGVHFSIFDLFMYSFVVALIGYIVFGFYGGDKE